MHDGAYTTLEEVVRHYSEATTQGAVGTAAVELKPILLTPGEESDLVEFLRSLTANGSSTSALTSPESH
jgi:cytochrome c peroxidase